MSGGTQFFASKSAQKECTLAAKPRHLDSTPYYEGPLIDSHIHMPVSSSLVSKVAETAGFPDMPTLKEIPADYLNCLFEAEGITKIFGFNIIPKLSSAQSVSAVKNINKAYPEMFINIC